MKKSLQVYIKDTIEESWEVEAEQVDIKNIISLVKESSSIQRTEDEVYSIVEKYMNRVKYYTEDEVKCGIEDILKHNYFFIRKNESEINNIYYMILGKVECKYYRIDDDIIIGMIRLFYNRE
ncbi:MAG: hypothetical protein ACRCTZ_07850 [Sarcina sp.]